MQASMVSAGLLRQRLDADFYSPGYLRNEAVLAASGLRLSTLGAEAEKCNCGATPKKVVYSDKGTPLIRGGEIKQCVLHTERVARVKGLKIAPASNVAAVPGDLVYTMSGASLGDAAVIPRGTAVSSFTNTVVRARFFPSMDSRFVAAYLGSRVGYANSRRHSSGGDRGHVMPNVFRQLPLPVPVISAQLYIGSKVRQAEALREWARGVYASVQDLHASLIPSYAGPSSATKPFRIRPQELRDVLLADAYPEDVRDYFLRVDGVRLGEVTETIYSGTTRPTSQPGEVWVLQATCRSCSGRFLKQPCNRVLPPASGDRYLQPMDLIVTNAAHDRTYIGKDFTFFHGGEDNFPSTKVMAIRVDKKQMPASYVHHFLMSPLGYRQTQAMVRGISAGISPTDLAEIMVPEPHGPNFDRAVWMATDEEMIRSAVAVEVAGTLVSTARLLVESLIERKVSEADLIAAAQNPDADRALLARLCEDGLDGDRDPLFADLDALSELLTEAATGGDA